MHWEIRKKSVESKCGSSLLGDLRTRGSFECLGESGRKGRALTCDLRADRAHVRQRSVFGLRRRVLRRAVRTRNDVVGSSRSPATNSRGQENRCCRHQKFTCAIVDQECSGIDERCAGGVCTRGPVCTTFALRIRRPDFRLQLEPI